MKEIGSRAKGHEKGPVVGQSAFQLTYLGVSAMTGSAGWPRDWRALNKRFPAPAVTGRPCGIITLSQRPVSRMQMAVHRKLWQLPCRDLPRFPGSIQCHV